MSGTNTIAIAGSNTEESPAGVVARLTVGDTVVVTDGTWRTSQTDPSGWEGSGFDDSGWVDAQVMAGYGDGLWGDGVNGISAAPYLRRASAVPLGYSDGAAVFFVGSGSHRFTT